jgi:hypothetical protein
MAIITDEFMREVLTKAKTYTVAFLKKTPKLNEPEARAIIWEHGRRNMSLRAGGVLAIVCPVADDSEWAGIGIFDASAEETVRIMDDDPAVKAGVLSYEVHPVRGFPGDSLAGDSVPRGPGG